MVNAINVCGGRAAADVEFFKKEVDRINVWASSCMLATEGRAPIGVLIAAKREDYSLVTHLALHRDYRRKGYGSQVLTSLRDKMAIIGPARLAAEVPEGRDDLKAFFAASGFKPEERLVDYTHDDLSSFSEPTAADELVTEMEVSDLLDEHPALKPRNEAALAWEKRMRALQNPRHDLRVLGVAGLDGIEGYICYKPADERACYAGPVEHRPTVPYHEVVAVALTENEGAELFLRAMLHRISDGHPIVFPKLHDTEIPHQLLESIGFAATASYTRYAIATMNQ